jgi:hypothetical protein
MRKDLKKNKLFQHSALKSKQEMLRCDFNEIALAEYIFVSGLEPPRRALRADLDPQVAYSLRTDKLNRPFSPFIELLQMT